MGQPSPVPGADPSTVDTPRQLRACLRGLKKRRGLSYSQLDEQAKKLPPCDGRAQQLPSSTLTDLLADHDRVPSKDVLLTFLDACGIAAGDIPLWLAAWERASTVDLGDNVPERLSLLGGYRAGRRPDRLVRRPPGPVVRRGRSRRGGQGLAAQDPEVARRPKQRPRAEARGRGAARWAALPGDLFFNVAANLYRMGDLGGHADKRAFSFS